MALSLSLSASVFREVECTNGILKFKLATLTENTGIPWPKVLPSALMTMRSTHFGKHKLTPL